MTAVVGILNKQAIALAADSAVTITGPDGTKILNRANKIFTLSKYNPVGIMIYNNAAFMDVPWETIIKMYRDQLQNRGFPKLANYQADFLQYLRDFDGLNDVQLQKLDRIQFARSVIYQAWSAVQIQIENETSGSEQGIDEYFQRLLREINTAMANLQTQGERLPDFQDFAIDEIESYKPDFQKVVKEFYEEFGQIPTIENLDLFYEYFALLTASPLGMIDFTGLVFCGYGTLEIYPQLLAVNVSSMVGNRLRFNFDSGRNASVSHRANSAIRPFAQTDVMNTLLAGIDPDLNALYMSNFDLGIQEFIGTASAVIRQLNPALADALQGFDYQSILKKIELQNQQIRKLKYIDPLMGAVASLSKEDLAEMAESLIYLTYLKRRMTQQEESVGGPVDVAVISKGDGFIWIKRKHYFSPELNQAYFKNYFHNNQ